MRVKEESKKPGLKLSIQKPKVMASGPIASWQIDGETMDWIQIGKGIRQSCILSPFLFNLYAEYIMQNARLDEAQTGISTLPGEISITSDMQMTPPLWQKVKRNSSTC